MTALDRYESARAELLHNEGDLDKLWKVIVAADHLAAAVGGRPAPSDGGAV